MKRADLLRLGLACALILSGPLQPVVADDAELDGGDGFEAEIYDPIEPVNRGIFWFNDQFDIYILEPVAQGYDKLPETIKDGVSNFFLNLRFPSYFVSDVIQLKFGQALQHSLRFVINSTAGIGGLIDVATPMGLEDHEEDFGIAMAYHGVPPGPYLVLPFLGPSNLRDGIGRAVDMVLNPVFHIGTIADMKDGEALAVSAGARALDAVSQRADYIDAVEAAKESALDYYFFMQSAYYQHRRGVLYDGNPPEEELLEGEPGQQ